MLQIVLHILQIIAELEQHAPAEGKSSLGIAQGAVRQAGVGQHRSPALRATQPQQLRFTQGAASLQLHHAVLLRLVDCEQAFVDTRVLATRVFSFDQPHHRPDDLFMTISR